MSAAITAFLASLEVDTAIKTVNNVIDHNFLAEITKTFHQQNKGVIHLNTQDIPSGINRAAFNQWRGQYWKMRAKDFEKERLK